LIVHLDSFPNIKTFLYVISFVMRLIFSLLSYVKVLTTSTPECDWDGIYYVSQAGLELVILLLPSAKFCNYRSVQSYLVLHVVRVMVSKGLVLAKAVQL
jgi:hypothetical protein